MNDITISNTPIFDRLDAELGYDRMISRGRDEAFRWPGSVAETPWIAKPVPTMAPQVVKVEEEIDADEAEEKYGNFHNFTEHVVREFYEKYPNGTNVTVSSGWVEDFQADAIKVVVSGLDSPTWLVADKTARDLLTAPEKTGGVKLAKAPEMTHTSFGKLDMNFVKDATEQFRKDFPYDIVTAIKPRGNPDGTVSMMIRSEEPEIGRSLVPDLAGQQLELYRFAAGIKPGEIEIDPSTMKVDLDDLEHSAYTYGKFVETVNELSPKPMQIVDEEEPDGE